ncbi:MAG: AbrB/MazE/SpoVT family DNA-binding domain-containing protein [Patescibacteria group bacterium]
MARNRSGKKDIRKLTRIAKYSLGLTLPAEVVRKLGWQERQKLVVRAAGRHLIIKDWRK